eukprot:scaffold269377_cov33-Tisochrysis_lutea.AAC.2
MQFQHPSLRLPTAYSQPILACLYPPTPRHPYFVPISFERMAISWMRRPQNVRCGSVSAFGWNGNLRLKHVLMAVHSCRSSSSGSTTCKGLLIESAWIARTRNRLFTVMIRWQAMVELQESGCHRHARSLRCANRRGGPR